MKITRVRVAHLTESLWGTLGHREKSVPFVGPMSRYPKYKHPLPSWYWDMSIAIVLIDTDEGVQGMGWCEDGVQTVKPIVQHHLERFLVGEDPFAVEMLWDQMFRATIPYGRKGAAIEAISAIDIALWDIMGKATGKPVYALLGGPVREQVPVYASALHPVGRDTVQSEARDYVAKGYKGMKLRFPCGPADGLVGMNENEDHVRSIREAVGDDVAIMADAYMGWDLPYAAKMCARLEKYDLAWLEEPFIPDDLKSYAKLRRETSIPISGGEHEFTRWGFQEIIEKEAMDILQPDLHRCGGITEGIKIATLASAAGLPVIPHAYSAPHAHFVAATVNCPQLEYFPVPNWADDAGVSTAFFAGEPEAQNGAVTPAGPGFGIGLGRELPGID